MGQSGLPHRGLGVGVPQTQVPPQATAGDQMRVCVHVRGVMKGRIRDALKRLGICSRKPRVCNQERNLLFIPVFFQVGPELLTTVTTTQEEASTCGVELHGPRGSRVAVELSDYAPVRRLSAHVCSCLGRMRERRE